MNILQAMPGWPTLAILGVLAAAMALAVVRLLRGPALADRVMALDVLLMAAVAIAAVAAMRYGQVVLLDVAVAVSLIAFIGTAAASWYLERRAEH